MNADDGRKLDAVDLKNQIQAQLLEERIRLGELEFNRRREAWLASSDEPLAWMWREKNAGSNVLASD